VTAVRRLVDKGPVSIGDADLVSRACEGERWAEDALYRRHSRAIGGLVARLLASSDEVEDIVHDAFVDAFTGLEKLRDRSAFKAWLSQIAVMRVRKALRTRRLRRALGLLPARDDLALEHLASRSVDHETRAELAAIDAALARTSTDRRLAWQLRYVEGHQLEEVAELTRCSLATVKRRIEAAERVIAPLRKPRPRRQGGES
jgi:RNA polymerase sigma-70 factor, ECF subfamily